jgi:N-formylglutamate amidohydrolase
LDQPYFEILAPAVWRMPVLFSSPHSGRLMPASFLAQSRLTEQQLRQSEDCFVDELFLGCLDSGAPLLRCMASRAYLDLNREPYELDARMFIESLPGYVNSASPRVAAGFGTVPRCVGEGQEIYRQKLPLSEAFSRIENLYRPYHRVLNDLLNQSQQRTGLVMLVDCHSMPSQSCNGKPIADIVLGDRFGTSCSPELVGAVESHLRAHGLHVTRNKPYAGAFITSAYGAPQQGRHALQIEINRSLYMDERTLEKTAGFSRLRDLLSGLIDELALIFQSSAHLYGRRLAAE